MCGIFGVIHDGACSTHKAIKCFVTENHIHRPNGCVKILFYIRFHGSVTPHLCSGMFSQIMPFVTYVF